MRTYFHLDMDAFFVSVEELFDPSLKGKPVVVGGHAHERGVVSAASYAARSFGVHSALPLRTAAKLCPQAIFLPGHPDRYRSYSRRVEQVLREFTPQVEMASVDEAYLDLRGTERLHGPPMHAAHTLHERMKRKTGLNCSIGIATARMVAKVASDQAKPNGILFVQPGLEAQFLAPLDVRRIPGVGKVTERKLNELGIRRVGDLARLESSFLEQRFGAWGLALAGKAQGQDAGAWFDTAEIGTDTDPKSVSHEHTFITDVADPETLEATLARLAEKVALRLRRLRFHARTVHLKLRYEDFTTLTRALTLSHATNMDNELIAESRTLYYKTWKRGAKVRLLGVGVSGLEPTEGQLSLLEGEKNERARKAVAAADRLRSRFGDAAVRTASALQGEVFERTHDALPMDKPAKDDSA